MFKIYQLLLPRYMIEMMTLLIIVGQINSVFSREPYSILNGVLLFLIFIAGSVISEKYKSFILYFFTPLFFIVFYFTGNALFSALLLSIVSVYRCDRLYMDRTRDLTRESLAVSLVIVLLAQFTHTTLVAPELYMFFSIMFLIQLFFYFLLKNVFPLITENIEGKDALKFAGSLFLLLIGGGFLVALFFRGLTLLIKSILIGILNILFFMLRPLLKWMDRLEFKTPELGEEESREEFLDETVMRLLEGEESHSLLETVPIEAFIVTGVILSIVFIIILLAMRSKKDEVYDTEKNQSLITQLDEGGKPLLKKKKPKDPIRQVYFDFEKWTQKQGIGRYVNETIEEWLERTNLKGVFSEQELEIYRTVRYSTHQYKDVTLFKSHIKKVQKRIKEMLKAREIK